MTLTTMTKEMMTRWVKFELQSDAFHVFSTGYDCTDPRITIGEWKQDIMTVHPTAVFKESGYSTEAWVSVSGDEEYVGCWIENDYSTLWTE